MARRSRIKEILQELDDYDFEHLIADLWADQGWKTRVHQASNDRGIDVEARRDDPFEQKHLIQAKRYSEGNKVGSEKIQQYASLRHQEENVDAVVIVTTSSYTKQAEEMAADLNLKLINGNDLVQIIQERDASDIVNGYMSINSSRTHSADPLRGNEGDRTQTRQTLNPDEVSKNYISELVENAIGDLVTKNRLTKLKPGMTHPQTLTEEPILGYLWKDEQPHFSFCSKKVIFSEDGVGEYDKYLKLSNNAYFVVTDLRILIIGGSKDGDVVGTVPFSRVNSVNIETNLFGKNKIGLDTRQDKFLFEIYHFGFNEGKITDKNDIIQEVENCAEYIEETRWK